MPRTLPNPTGITTAADMAVTIKTPHRLRPPSGSNRDTAPAPGSQERSFDSDVSGHAIDLPGPGDSRLSRTTIGELLTSRSCGACHPIGARRCRLSLPPRYAAFRLRPG